MTVDTTPQPLRERNKQLARHVVLDAAERLLQASPNAEFSMRALAAEAGVGFATPFNHFGSKNAIMQALSSRLIERMEARFRDEAPYGDAIDRVLGMGRIAVALLLEKPTVYKVVVGSLGVVSAAPSLVQQNSRRLWSLALGDCDGISADRKPMAKLLLAEQLAFTFRGCVSFWIAGDLPDEHLGSSYESGVCTLLLGFATPERQSSLMTMINSLQAAPTGGTV